MVEDSALNTNKPKVRSIMEYTSVVFNLMT